MDEKYLYNEEESIDIKAFVFKNLKYWHIYVFFVFVTVISAYFINRVTSPVYKVTSWVLISDEEDLLDLKTFAGASLYSNPFKLSNEIGILKSKELTKRTLIDLNYEITYFKEGRFFDEELSECPFIVEFDTVTDQPVNVKFKVTFINDTLLYLESKSENVNIYNFGKQTNTGFIDYFEFTDSAKFGELTGNQYCRFRIMPVFNLLNDGKYYKYFSFQFNSLNSLISVYSDFNVETEKNSSILKVSLNCSNIDKGIRFLNALTENYLRKGVERENRISENTLNFIDNQIRGISDSLSFSEENLQNFRSTNQVMNLDYQAQQVWTKYEELQSRRAELLVKFKYYDYLKDYLKQNKGIDDLIAPTSMDINDPLLNNLILELKDLYTELSDFSFNSIKDNPAITSLEYKIKETKEKLIENIETIISATNISVNDLEKRIGEFEGRINKLPKSHRELLGYERQFKLNDALYTFLLTKRSEVEITKASNIPSNEVLDKASRDETILVKPNIKLNYVIALLLGIFVPAGLIYLHDLFLDRITDKNELNRITQLPVVGQIIHNKNNIVNAVDKFPESLLAESFRSLRTNLQFIPGKKEKNVILISSIITGEGKSFVAINLASALAQNKKKVVLLDFDLRKSKIKKYLNIENTEGISTYLSGVSSLDDIIIRSGLSSIDLVLSGPVPPNPVELISSAKTETLFSNLKKSYDYIIIDSPPIGMVSDGLLLINYSDINLFVLRYNYTPKSLFASVINDFENRNISNINLIVNDIKITQNGYGYNGYGYGYGHLKEKKNILSGILPKNNADGMN